VESQPSEGQVSQPRAEASSAAAGGSQTVRRVLLLLDQFTVEQPTHTVDQLSRAMNVPISTVYRLIKLLRTHEVIEQGIDGRYQLGPRAITMGYVARSKTELADLWTPALESLTASTGETSLILRRVGDAAVCVDRVESDHPIRLSFEIGRFMPLHTGAGAKVLLAHSPPEVVEHYLARMTGSPGPEALRVELAQIRERGWGESSGEVDPGIWAVAAPILVERGGRCVVMSLALPDYRLGPGRREFLLAETLKTTDKLRSKLLAFG